MKDIKTLVDKPEYMHHAYFIPNAVGFINDLKMKGIKPFIDRILPVKQGFNTNPHAFNDLDYVDFYAIAVLKQK